MPLNQTLQQLSPAERKRLVKLSQFEKIARSKGYRHLAGVDEAGRGPLAGPVVAAACSIQRGLLFSGIKDSKLLTPSSRRTLFEQLTSHSGVQFGVGIVDHVKIDEINIYHATLEAMRIAVGNLPSKPDCVLVDGMPLAIDEIHTEKIVHGDSLSYIIAAASIIAKETRDRLMQEYHQQYPKYGFDAHKGYATKAHRLALAKYGPCPIHRLSFSLDNVS